MSDSILSRETRIAIIKLELESARHVIGVIGQKPISARYSEELKRSEIDHYRQIEKILIDRLFELEILSGD